MRLLALLPLALLATGASAQNARVEKPFRIEVGAFFPNYRGASFGDDLGVAASLGYAFARKGNVEILGSLRSAYHLATLGGGGASGAGDGAEDNSLTLTSAFVDARYAPVGCRFFGGVGLGVGRAILDDSPDHTGLLLAAEGGYSLSRSVYVAVRYQHGGPDAFRGATASLGFRL